MNRRSDCRPEKLGGWIVAVLLTCLLSSIGHSHNMVTHHADIDLPKSLCGIYGHGELT